MTSEEFAIQIGKVIAAARDAGLSDDDIVTELQGIVDMMQDGG